MTSATTLPNTERQHYSFLSIFKNNEVTTRDIQVTEDIPQEEKIENPLVERLNRTQIVSVVALHVVPAGKLFVSNKYSITLRLTDQFAKQFVLLRGLLEFSRPKAIAVSSNLHDQIFEIVILESQAEYLLSYLETIIGWFVKEIKFKETLKAIISFEKRVKEEQAIWYSKMRSSLA